MTEAVARIRRMEEVYDTLQTILASGTPDPRQDGLLAELKAYYEGGRWRSDYELDEQGLLPADLKRGVLSQDGVWELLGEIEEWSVEIF